MPEKINTTNLDANESAFFARELEHIKARSYDIQYPEYKATRLIPVSSEAGSGADSITYQQFDSVGIMKIISNYADDLPRSDIKGKEFTVSVKGLGGSYGYNRQEIRSATMAGRPLQQRKANAARRAYDQAVERIAFLARSDDGVNGGLVGLIYNANTTKAAAPVGGSSGHTLWINTTTPANVKTPAEIVKDMSDLIVDVDTLTLGVEQITKILLPRPHYGKISNTRMEAGTDTTILQFFLRNNPGVSVEAVNQLRNLDPKPSGGSGPTNVMLGYNPNPDKLTLEIPMPWEQLPVQERGLEFLVNTEARIGGVIIYYPLSVSILEDI